MSGDKRTSKRGNGRKGTVAAFGVAGALSLSGACSASASNNSAGNMMQNSTRVLLAEEEISDVSLVTFYAFDRKMPVARVCSLLPAMGVVGMDAANGCGGRGCAGVDAGMVAEGVDVGVVVAVGSVDAAAVAAVVVAAVYGLPASASAERRTHVWH